ncbi:MAG: hypothetical protein ACI37Z_04970 [Candidatus Gastranaerophilaceae bacterium]
MERFNVEEVILGVAEIVEENRILRRALNEAERECDLEKQTLEREEKAKKIIEKISQQINEKIKECQREITEYQLDGSEESLLTLQVIVNNFANVFAIKDYIECSDAFRECYAIYGGDVDRIIYKIDDEAINIILSRVDIVDWAIVLLEGLPVQNINYTFWNETFVGIFDRIEYKNKLQQGEFLSQ